MRETSRAHYNVQFFEIGYNLMKFETAVENHWNNTFYDLPFVQSVTRKELFYLACYISGTDKEGIW